LPEHPFVQLRLQAHEHVCVAGVRGQIVLLKRVVLQVV